MMATETATTTTTTTTTTTVDRYELKRKCAAAIKDHLRNYYQSVVGLPSEWVLQNAVDDIFELIGVELLFIKLEERSPDAKL